MHMNKELYYNLPGYGPINITLFPYANCVYDFLAYYGHDIRLQNTNQLGILRNVFKGAHHTRYEYVIIQWAFVNELMKIKGNSDVNISSNRDEYPQLDDFDKSPSGAEVMQILILLANAGHLPETFTALRSLLHILHQNKIIRIKFRSGLDERDRDFFDETLDLFQVFHVQYLLMLFLLQRYKRLDKCGDGKSIVDLASSILRDYINKQDEKREPLKKIWGLYDNIRRISYLALDSHYTPVPFSINLSSIILNIEELVNTMVDPNSSFQLALQQLNEVVRDNVYMCGPTLLEISRVTEQTVNRINVLENKLDSITALRHLIEPNNQSCELEKPFKEIFNTQFLARQPNPDWGATSIVHLTYSTDSLYQMIKFDTVLTEKLKRKKIGISSCRVGVQVCPERQRLTITYGIINNMSDNDKIRTALAILSDILYFEGVNIDPNYSKQKYNNNHQCVGLFIKSIFSWKTRFKLEGPAYRNISPFFMGRGSKKASKWLKKYIEDICKHVELNKDCKHELKFIDEIITDLSSLGSLICFAGSTKVMLNNAITESAEFDGLIILPNEDPYIRFAIIVEAKNQKDGHKAGQNQLEKRLEALLINDIDYVIEPVYQKGAYATLRLKR